MTTTRARIRALEAKTAGALPVLILSYEGRYGTAGDGLYYAGDKAYTPAEVDELCNTHTVITLSWEDWPPGKVPDIQMTWGDND